MGGHRPLTWSGLPTYKAAPAAHASGGGPARRGRPPGAAALGAPAARGQALLKQLVRVGVRHRGEARWRKDVRWVQEGPAQAIDYKMLRIEGVQVGDWRGRQGAVRHGIAVGSLCCMTHLQSAEGMQAAIVRHVRNSAAQARQHCAKPSTRAEAMLHIWQPKARQDVVGNLPACCARQAGTYMQACMQRGKACESSTILYKTGKVLVDVTPKLLLSLTGSDRRAGDRRVPGSAVAQSLGGQPRGRCV